MDELFRENPLSIFYLAFYLATKRRFHVESISDKYSIKHLKTQVHLLQFLANKVGNKDRKKVLSQFRTYLRIDMFHSAFTFFLGLQP